jgi:repressor LexA
MQNARENSCFRSHPDDATVAGESDVDRLETQHFDASAVQNSTVVSGEITPAVSASSDRVLDRPKLTAIQQAVLDFVQAFHLARGVPPTRVEISAHFKWDSPNAAHGHLKVLERKGRIRFLRGQNRNIRVLNETEMLSLPRRTPIQLQAIEVRKIWDQEGCHSPQFPEALTALLDMVLR